MKQKIILIIGISLSLAFGVEAENDKKANKTGIKKTGEQCEMFALLFFQILAPNFIAHV